MSARLVETMFEAEGHRLDYSMRSLDLIDTRIEHFRQEGETSDSMPTAMTAFGIYVGEAIRRTLGRGEWVEGTRLDIDGIVADPIGKCMKRLDQGASDSVRAFGDAIVLIANMPEEERQNNLVAAVEGQIEDVTHAPTAA